MLQKQGLSKKKKNKESCKMENTIVGILSLREKNMKIDRVIYTLSVEIKFNVCTCGWSSL